MILHKIQLRGFLSHRGVPDASQHGGFGFTELDFSRSALWLIHGENGTGKSTIFDAIYFALYKRARGKGEGSQNHGYLIHHEADRAEVRLFLEVGGRKFRVDRAIKRRTEPGKSTPDSAVYDGWEVGAKMLPETKNKVEIWTKNTLHMDADTFAYAVLLRQGDTDRFLKADAADRKSCLLQLLDLGDFTKLGNAADEEHSAARKGVKEAKTRLEGVEALEPDALEKARKVIEDAQGTVENARETFTSADVALVAGQKAARWQSTILELEALNQAEQELLGRESQIIQSARRWRELGRVLPLLSGLRNSKNRLVGEEIRLQAAREAISRAQEEADEIKAQTSEEKLQESAARDAQQLAQNAFDEAEIQAKSAGRNAQTLREIETLEVSVETQNKLLVPHRDWLNRAEAIEADFKRWSLLKTQLPALQALKTALQAEEKARFTLEKAIVVEESARIQVENLSAASKEADQQIETVNEQMKVAQNEATDLKIRFEQLKACSNLRKEVEGKDDCPYCGSSLCEATTGERLKEERETWNQQGKELKSQRDSQDLLLADLAVEAETALANGKTATKRARQAELEAQTVKSDLKHAELRSNECEKAVTFARTTCGDIGDEIERLSEMQQDFLGLASIEVDHQKLRDAQKVETRVHAARGVHEENLSYLPNWSPQERQSIQEIEQEVTAILAQRKVELEAAKVAQTTAQKALTALEAKLEKVGFELGAAQQQAADLVVRCQRESEAVAAAQDDLEKVEDWGKHPATVVWEEFGALESERESLNEAESEEMALREAQKNCNQTIGEIKSLRSQIDALPAAHRRALDELESERSAAENALEQAKIGESKCLEAEGELKRQSQERQTREQDVCEAEKEASITEKLANALGKAGLQSTIQRRAQDKLKAEANKILGRLTQNEWTIHMPEMGNDRLEIWATDHRTSRDVQFEYISGGERMRICVALAVAIGQSVSGATVKSLIIDEGFGTLDGPNRDRMVKELRRLSEDEFGGGRVIVISHQDDVCEPFTHRFHIERDKEGLVKATPFPMLLTP